MSEKKFMEEVKEAIGGKKSPNRITTSKNIPEDKDEM